MNLGRPIVRIPTCQVISQPFKGAGFRLDGASVFPILNLSWDDDAYSKGLAQLVRNFVANRGDVPAEEPGKC